MGHAIDDDHDVASVRPAGHNQCGCAELSMLPRSVPLGVTRRDVVGRVYRHTPCRVRSHPMRIGELPHFYDLAPTSRWFVTGRSGAPLTAHRDACVQQKAGVPPRAEKSGGLTTACSQQYGGGDRRRHCTPLRVTRCTFRLHREALSHDEVRPATAAGATPRNAKRATHNARLIK